jgi:hypothetical protein
VYLVSKDRQMQTNYLRALEHAIQDVQKFYARQMNGATFKLHSPLVEVVHSEKKATWFYSNPNGSNQDDWGFNNTLAEAFKLVGARYNDPHYIWVIYSDGPGNKGRGGSGVTCLPEDDLLGLVGQHPTQRDPPRWVGGLAHELGHAFGLPHPEDTEKHADAIMWAGFYGKYPNETYLTEDDKKILSRSPFFFDAKGRPVVRAEFPLEKYAYDGGYFVKFTNILGKAFWKEGKTDADHSFYFDEVSRTGEMISLKDASRGMSLELPVKGGHSRLSSDGGAQWHPLYEVRPVAP